VETAVAVCKFVLQSAMSQDPGNSILARLRLEHPPSVVDSVEQLLARHSRVARPFELLTPAGILEMLPTETSAPLQKYISALETSTFGTREETDNAKDFEKSRFAAILAVLYGANTHGIKLPRRITTWVKQLAEWYPPDSESWAYVPTPGPWSPGEEPPPDLVSLLAATAATSPSTPIESNIKRWLRPERLCWGWNVMQEEIVAVPTGLLSATNKLSGAGREQDSILIYWQRY